MRYRLIYGLTYEVWWCGGITVVLSGLMAVPLGWLAGWVGVSAIMVAGVALFIWSVWVTVEGHRRSEFLQVCVEKVIEGKELSDDDVKEGVFLLASLAVIGCLVTWWGAETALQYNAPFILVVPYFSTFLALACIAEIMEITLNRKYWKIRMLNRRENMMK